MRRPRKVNYLHFALAVGAITAPDAVPCLPDLSRSELDFMYDAAERGETPADFAQWLAACRVESRFPPHDERDPMGDETVAVLAVA